MATSSIFASFDIRDKKTAEAFVEALEASEKNLNKKPPDVPKCISLTEPDEIRKLFARRKNKK